MTLPVASQACTELVKCGCKSSRGDVHVRKLCYNVTSNVLNFVVAQNYFGGDIFAFGKFTIFIICGTDI